MLCLKKLGNIQSTKDFSGNIKFTHLEGFASGIWKIYQSEIPHSPVMLCFCSDPVLWPVCPTHDHILREQTLKTHRRHALLFSATAPDPPISLAPFLPSNSIPACSQHLFQSSGLPFAACTHQWTWWQNLASLNPTFGISWKIAACMHISYPWVLTGPLHLRAHPSFSPNWPRLELAALRAHHDCSYIQHELKNIPFLYKKDTTSTTSIRMQFELFLSQWFFFLEVVNS